VALPLPARHEETRSSLRGWIVPMVRNQDRSRALREGAGLAGNVVPFRVSDMRSKHVAQVDPRLNLSKYRFQMDFPCWAA
jgi:hypothetical protein